MSLVAFALRLMAHRLVHGQTWAGDRVVNSPIDPLMQWDLNDQPVVAIYSGRRMSDVEGMATQGRQTTVDLTFVIIAPPKAVQVSETLELHTDNTGGAVLLDFVARQIDAALRFGPVAWLTPWRLLTVQVEKVEARPLLYETDKGVTMPATEVTYQVVAVPDPGFGGAPLPGWQALLNAMAADEDYAALAPLLEAAMTTPEGMPDWVKAQAFLGLSDAAVTGIKPLDPTATDDGALLQTLNVVDGGPIDDD